MAERDLEVPDLVGPRELIAEGNHLVRMDPHVEGRRNDGRWPLRARTRSALTNSWLTSSIGPSMPVSVMLSRLASNSLRKVSSLSLSASHLPRQFLARRQQVAFDLFSGRDVANVGDGARLMSIIDQRGGNQGRDDGSVAAQKIDLEVAYLTLARQGWR